MSALLRFEFRKLFREKKLYICLGAMIVTLLLNIAVQKVMTDMLPVDFAELPGMTSLPFSGVACLLYTADYSSFTLIAAIFSALVVCIDYERKTVRNVISRGYTRLGIYLSKYVAVIVGSTVMFALSALFSFAAGSLFFGVGDVGNIKYLSVLGAQYVSCMAYVSLTFAVSAMLRRTGASIPIVIIAPSILGLLLSLADFALKTEKFKIADGWLTSFIADLSSVTVSDGRIAFCLALSVIYGALFVIVGYLVNRKAEF